MGWPKGKSRKKFNDAKREKAAKQRNVDGKRKSTSSSGETRKRRKVESRTKSSASALSRVAEEARRSRVTLENERLSETTTSVKEENKTGKIKSPIDEKYLGHCDPKLFVQLSDVDDDKEASPVHPRQFANECMDKVTSTVNAMMYVPTTRKGPVVKRKVDYDGGKVKDSKEDQKKRKTLLLNAKKDSEWLRPAMAGLLASPFHKVVVTDRWSPLEVAKFEAALCIWGKHFHRVQSVVKTKCTKEVIEFYYAWKKSPNYQKWKRSYCPLPL
eukprot:g6049.t1